MPHTVSTLQRGQEELTHSLTNLSPCLTLSPHCREDKKKIIILVVPTILGILLLFLLLTLFGYYCQKRAKSKEKTAQLTARMTGFDETEVRGLGARPGSVQGWNLRVAIATGTIRNVLAV